MSQAHFLKPKLLDVIIPTYKRPKGAAAAALSVLKQLNEYAIEDKVNLIIWDDRTPELDIKQIALELARYNGLFVIGQNSTNKGMSNNICDLVQASKSDFCTILTDDDWFEPSSLPEIVEEIGAIQTLSPWTKTNYIGAFFVPRYSYLDDGTLHCIECAPFTCDTIISQSPANVIKYCRNAFILTGLFFRPSLVDFTFWRAHQENAFFPIIYYASISIASNVKFLDRKWLHHTCLNQCHWEAWGSNDLQVYSRLHLDYLRALILVAHAYSANRFVDRLQHAEHLHQALRGQFLSYRGPLITQLHIVLSLFSRSLVLLVSYLLFLCEHQLSKLKLKIISLSRRLNLKR